MNDEIIGTASLIKIDVNTFELAKLAVAEKYQGFNVGKRLIEKCLSIAKKGCAEKVILYTNHNLTAVIYLYKKYNFKEVQTLHASKYLESDL
jgi:ribosomal protein S18 acetylase RimI-like enzyme